MLSTSDIVFVPSLDKLLVRTRPSSCPPTVSTTGCWLRSGFVRLTSITTRLSHTCWGRTWWWRCSPSPSTGSCRRFTQRTRCPTQQETHSDTNHWNDVFTGVFDRAAHVLSSSCSSHTFASLWPSTPRPESSSSTSGASLTRWVRPEVNCYCCSYRRLEEGTEGRMWLQNWRKEQQIYFIFMLYTIIILIIKINASLTGHI